MFFANANDSLNQLIRLELKMHILTGCPMSLGQMPLSGVISPSPSTETDSEPARVHGEALDERLRSDSQISGSKAESLKAQPFLIFCRPIICTPKPKL